MKAVFFPMARTTFFMESAEQNLQQSRQMLQEIFTEVVMPDKLLTETSEVAEFAEQAGQPDLIIYQCSTFIGSEFISELTRRFRAPMVIWSVREPSMDGGRLKLNSLTGAFSAANCLKVQGRDFEFVFGSPSEEQVKKQFEALSLALEARASLRQAVVGIVGSQPAGFGFGDMSEAEAGEVLGLRFVNVEAAALMDKARSYEADTLKEAVAELKSRTQGVEELPAENLDKYARLRKAFGDFVEENGLCALASRCWPDFFTGYGAPVCAVLSMLNENGIAASCETDVGGAVTMYLAQQMTGGAVYFGDPVAVDEEHDAIVYWHCGAGASCLASPKTGAKLGVHPNRRIGPTMEFGLKPGRVTVLRLGHDAEGYRMFCYTGEALPEPQKFWGTSVTVRPDGGSTETRLQEFVADGWEPHFVVAYGEIAEPLRVFCKFAGIRFNRYGEEN